MNDTRADMLQGTLDLLILETLLLGPMHGWGVSQRIQELSSDVLQINQGSLYPALHRLEHRGLIKSEWGVSENNRRAKFYRLTAGGHAQVQRERGDWRRFTEAVEQVLRATRRAPDPA
jgi:PadR family transcriptional regulator, regulatory protein PadR